MIVRELDQRFKYSQKHAYFFPSIWSKKMDKGTALQAFLLFLFLPTKKPCQLRKTFFSEEYTTNSIPNWAKVNCQTLLLPSNKGGCDQLFVLLYTYSIYLASSIPLFWVGPTPIFFSTWLPEQKSWLSMGPRVPNNHRRECLYTSIGQRGV